MAILTTLKMTKFQCILDLYGHAGVAQSRPRQAIERGNVPGHFVKQPFNAHEAVLAGDVIDEVVQEFPFGPASPGAATACMNFWTRPLAS